MLKTRVYGAGIYKMCGAEHADTAQTLKCRVIDDFDDAWGERDIATFGDPQAGGWAGAQAEFW